MGCKLESTRVNKELLYSSNFYYIPIKILQERRSHLHKCVIKM